MFWGYSFIFDNIPSERFGLYILNFESGLSEANNADISIVTKEIQRRPVNYFLGVSQSAPLTFDIDFVSPTAIDGNVRSIINKYLFGQTGYKKLQIMQCDLSNVYFNCFLVNPRNIYTGNENIGYKATVVCDSPFAWEFPKTVSKTYGETITSDTFNFFNTSADNDYMYPNITFKTNALGDSISIVNESDGDREFEFTNIDALETVTVDNDRQIVTSSSGENRLGDFNKKWFRLVSGKNVLSVSGGLESFTMTYQLARKVGG